MIESEESYLQFSVFCDVQQAQNYYCGKRADETVGAKFGPTQCTAHATAAGGVSERTRRRVQLENASNSVICYGPTCN